MSEQVMMNSVQMETHVEAFEKTQPGMRAAIRKALEAGVPWLTIISWIVSNGGLEFIKKIADLIVNWKNPPAPPTV